VNERLLAVDPKDSPLCLALLDTLLRGQQLSDRQLAAAKAIMNSGAAEPAIRVKAIHVLSWEWAGDPAIEAVVDALGNVAVGNSPPTELAAALKSFVQNPQLARRIPLLARLAGHGPAGRREIALAALVSIAGSKLTEPEPRSAAEGVIAKAWQDPAAVVPLLRAIDRTKAQKYGEQVRARMRDNDPETARAATAAARRLGITENAATTQPRDTIATLGYDKALASVLKTAGDAKRGKELFASQGCVACHTVSPADPPKGPFLGGIASRYSRRELCESVLKPSAKIAQGFETQWFKVKGDVVEGFVTREAGEEIEFRDVRGNTTVLKKDAVKARGTRNTSVMPEELAAKLTAEELASLLTYLESLPAQ
jgi:putative heme-binding domain-containing protein